ncbi:uncharacterized protein LOC143917789 [Arctopsyche grandis]|uniref:uncharacterized protein LOC143917789 n=1 Tax=Arctopsyche grandis TaxID=121162 RepID=UPI00406D9C6E
MYVFGSVCCCCLSGSSLRSLLLPHPHNGEMEVYADMIHKCYGIKMISQDKNVDMNLFMICDSCVSRLREAFLFRLQVEVACESIEKELKNCNYFAEEQSASKKVTWDVHKVEVTFDDGPSGNDSDFDYCQTSNDGYQSNLKNEPMNIEDKCSKTLNHSNVVIEKIVSTSKKYDRKKNDCKKLKNIKNQTNLKVKPMNVEEKCNELLNNSSVITEKLNTISKKYNRKKTKDKKPKDINEQPFKLDKTDVTCKICNETFASNVTLLRHMSVHFPNYVCQVCGKFCITKTSLVNHVRRHEESPLQTCEICNKTYKSVDNLKQHMKRHNRNTHKCPQCTETFSSYYSRCKHLAVVHNEEPKKYKCKICPKRYCQANALNRHIRSSHLREKKFTCNVCSAYFFVKSTLNRHMIKHTNVKKFNCDVCKKSFAMRYTLSEHMKIHNNVKNFVCTICNRAFTQKCTLKGHMKVHEKETQSNLSLNDDN